MATGINKNTPCFVGSKVTVLDTSFTSGAVKKVTIPQDGYYYAVAYVNTSSSNSEAQVTIFDDAGRTNIITVGQSKYGNYNRACTALIPFKRGTDIYIQAVFNDTCKFCRLE